MGFEKLLGNVQLKSQLQSSVRRGRMAHFYLLSGPEGSGKHTLSDLLAAAMLCTGQEKPCFRCEACRKVMAHTHPDYVIVDDPEKKTVPVELIRQARADMYVRPNEGERKIYCFPRGQDMGIPGQNALLKVLEEPPAYGVFLILTDNPEKLLPTVRSRCVELPLRALSPEQLTKHLKERYPQADDQTIAGAVARSGGYLGQALSAMEEGSTLSPQSQAFLESFAASDALGLLRVLVPMERWKRDQLIPELNQWIRMLHGALLSRSGIAALSGQEQQLGVVRSAAQLTHTIEVLEKAVQYAQGNVSVAAICGYLQWALR